VKIAILTAGFPPEAVGGTEIQVSQVAMQLAKQHHVTVFTRSRVQPDTYHARLAYRICRRSVCDLSVLRFPIDILSTLLCLYRYRKNIDIILAYQTMIDGLIGAIAKRIFHIPVATFIRSEKECQIDEFYVHRMFTLFVFRNSDKLCVQSQRIKKYLLNRLRHHNYKVLAEIVAKKIVVIPNGICLKSVGLAHGDAILFVGRLEKLKGLEYLLAAMQECPEETLLIVGDGPEMGHLARLAQGMQNVTFVGQVSHAEVVQYMQKARVLVLPSLSEGLPNVVLEAMAHGLPVIASRVGGIPDLLTDGVTGFLVTPGSVPELVRAIKILTTDTCLREAFSRRCLQVIQSYSWQTILPLLERELIQVARGTHTTDKLPCGAE